MNGRSNDPPIPGDASNSFEELMSRACRGSAEAIGDLMEHYRNYLLLIANQDVRGDLRTKVGASDVVQESIMHAQMNFNQFNGDSEPELKAWLRTILANDIRKSRRRYHAQKRDASLEINIQEQSAVGRSLLDAQMTPGSEAVAEEKSRALAGAMDQLSADQRKAVQLRNFESKSFEEIGRQMGRSADAARKLWARAIESLEKNLRKNEVLTGNHTLDVHDD